MERITKRTLALLLTLVMVIGFMPGNLYASANDGVTLYVDGVNGDDANDGTSAATAFATIQKALNSITDDSVQTTILVADGAYNCYSPNNSANELPYGDSTGHSLYINKSNVTITKANAEGTVTLYSYIGSATAGQRNAPTVRIDDGASNVTLDGLTILPSMKGSSDGVYTTAANANEFAFLANDGIDVSESSETQVYLPIHSSSNLGVITVNTGAKGTASNVTIQNCTIGYNNETFATKTTTIYSINLIGSATAGMQGDWHIENNTIYGRVHLKTYAGTDNNTFLNNQLYWSHLIIKSTTTADLPLIRGNTQHSAHTVNNSGYPYFIDSNYSGATIAKYSDAEISVMAKTNFGPEGYQYAAKNKASYSVVIFKSTDADTVMDSPEELGYYLGQEGTVTLDQSYEITNARMLPNQIKATVDFAGFQITKPADLDIPAPQGWKWENNVLVEAPVVSDKTDWITTSLLLNNDLNMRFYVPAEDLAEGDYLLVTMEGADDPVPLKVWKDGTGKNADKKYATFEGIFATQMTNEVTVVLCSANGQAKAGYAVHEDSICKYAERLAASNPEVKWMRLMDAVLNYGAAAQLAEAVGEVAEEDLPTYGWTWTEPAA